MFLGGIVSYTSLFINDNPETPSIVFKDVAFQEAINKDVIRKAFDEKGDNQYSPGDDRVH
jgi:hypothetical protein